MNNSVHDSALAISRLLARWGEEGLSGDMRIDVAWCRGGVRNTAVSFAYTTDSTAIDKRGEMLYY